MNARAIITIAIIFSVLSLWLACSDDGGSDVIHWFSCKPVLQKLDDCGIQISLDGQNITDAEAAYDSCQFGRGEMWLLMFKCYKQYALCSELAECLPDHGFIIPGESDDTAGDDSVSDDTTVDDTAGDDTAAADDTVS